MYHDTPLISTIVAGLVLAFIFGMIANRLRMPPLVGYLIAGILAGPYTPGFVADQALGAELAEIGVILLMFGVGLHFSLKDLMSVRALAIPGALGQIALATLLGLGLGLVMGWGMAGGLLFGLALSVASTVVLLKALQDRRLIESERGRIAVGWLIVEDLAMVLALVLIPAIAGLNGGGEHVVHDPFVSFVERMLRTDVGIWGVLGLTLVKVAAFVGFMLIVGRRVIPWALHATAHTGSRELFRLAVLAIALGVALGSAVLFGVSLALGAFFAGMILSESELSHRAAQETLPLRDAFAVLFFVSVGMLFDPSIIITQPLPVLATVFIIVIGKSIAAFGIVALFRRPVGTALTISASLAQIGEFSFILASMGVSLAIMPKEAQDLILAGALISIVLNPVVFFISERILRPRFEAGQKRRTETAEPERIEPTDRVEASQGPITTSTPGEAAVDRGRPGADDDTGEPVSLTDHTILVGYGQVGRVVAAGLKADETPLVVIEDSDHDVAAARAEGFEVVYGNAASEDVLKLANLQAARNLLIAISNGFEAGSVCESGRKLNPTISIVARAYSEEEETFLRSLGATMVIRGEYEIGMGILAHLRDARRGLDLVEEVQNAKLPASENLLARAAAAPAAAAVAVTEVSVPGPTEVVADVIEAEPAPEPVAEIVETPPADEAVAVEAEAEVVEPTVTQPEPVIDEPVMPVPGIGETLVENAVPVIDAPLPEPVEPAEISIIEEPEPELPPATLEEIRPVEQDNVETASAAQEIPGLPVSGEVAQVDVGPNDVTPTEGVQQSDPQPMVEAEEPLPPPDEAPEPDDVIILGPPTEAAVPARSLAEPGLAAAEPETPEPAAEDVPAPAEEQKAEENAPGTVPPVVPEPKI